MLDEEAKDIIAHYGVLGMKWGVITARAKGAIASGRKKETAYQKKLGLASRTANKNKRTTDAYLMAYRSKGVASRAAQIAGQEALRQIAGKSIGILSMSKPQLYKMVGETAMKSAANMLLHDQLAKNVSKRYNDAGKNIKTTKGWTPEEKVLVGAEVARVALWVAKVSGVSATSFTGKTAGYGKNMVDNYESKHPGVDFVDSYIKK